MIIDAHSHILSLAEDPEFTIKEAVIITPYPGASAEEVANEVTNPIESAVQQLDQLNRVDSESTRGMSVITAVIQDRFHRDAMPQVWDELANLPRDNQAARTPAYPLLLDVTFLLVGRQPTGNRMYLYACAAVASETTEALHRKETRPTVLQSRIDWTPPEDPRCRDMPTPLEPGDSRTSTRARRARGVAWVHAPQTWPIGGGPAIARRGRAALVPAARFEPSQERPGAGTRRGGTRVVSSLGRPPKVLTGRRAPR